MNVRSVVAISLLVLLGCNPPRPPSAGRDATSRADAGPGDGGAAPTATALRGDPCAVLEPAQRDLVVARVGDQRLTLCDFTRRVNVPNPYLRARFNAPEQRRAMLQSWVDAELLAAEAQHQGLDREPAVRRAVTMQLARRLEQQLREEVTQPTVTDAEVRAYYDAHRSEYETPAQVRASQVVLATRAQADRTLAELRARPNDDALFRQRVRELSIDNGSRSAEGDLGFFGPEGGNGVEPEVARAATALSAQGAYAEVVESAHGGLNRGRGFHVVRLTARREALHRSFDDEARRIRARLLRDKYEAAQEAAVRAVVTRLRGQTPVQIDEAALAAVAVRVDPSAPRGPTVLPPGLGVVGTAGGAARP